MRKVLLATALGVAALLQSGVGHADDTRFYLRGNVGQTDIKNVDDIDDSDTVLGIDFGWRFLPWLSLEAGYNQLGDYDHECSGEVCLPVVIPPLEFDSVELGLAARVPFGDAGWFGQARAGLHHWDVEGGGSENDPYYGLGVGYSFNDRFALSLNYDRYEAEFIDIDRVGLGFEVSF